MKQNKGEPDKYRDYLKKSLDNKIAGQIEKLISTESLLSDTSKASLKLTWDFYNHSALSYVNPYGKGKDEKKQNQVKSEKKVAGQHEAVAYTQSVESLKVMDNTIDDPNWLKGYSASFGSDLILSVNQFEIKTNYNSCMDIARQIYRREIHVHYTIMDANGKRLAGNVAVGTFPSNDNRVEDIAEKVFPQVAGEISQTLKVHLH